MSISRGRRAGRRSFLRGAAGVSLALPFLESLPDRSAWAAEDSPIFSLFICGTGGVVTESFFPSAFGPLTTEGLAAAGKATSALARHAERLLFVSGVDFPDADSADDHQQGLARSFTGASASIGVSSDQCPMGQSSCLHSSGRSADWEVCARAAAGTEPLVLYYGDRAYTSECLSYSAAGPPARAILNPYEVYQRLVGLVGPGGGMTPQGEQAARLLIESRKSVHDLVREDLGALLRHPRLGSADKQRLQQHLDSIRDAEVTFGGMANEAAEQCSAQGLDVSALEALADFRHDRRRTEEIIGLHLRLVALAFACNYCRSASLQWGDAYDQSIYAVPSNAREWKFTHISHRLESDSSTGDDPLAAKAHAEIDALRMATLASGLDELEARGLGDNSVVLWTNQYAEGPTHSMRSVPHVVWGSPGGYLKQAQYVDAGGVRNDQMLNAVLSAAVRDTGKTVEDFGEGVGGQLGVVLA
jgi:Protein of unknown function (DUF1552)